VPVETLVTIMGVKLVTNSDVDWTPMRYSSGDELAENWRQNSAGFWSSNSCPIVTVVNDDGLRCWLITLLGLPVTVTATSTLPAGWQSDLGTTTVSVLVVAAVTVAVSPPTVTRLSAAVALNPVPVSVAGWSSTNGFGVTDVSVTLAPCAAAVALNVAGELVRPFTLAVAPWDPAAGPNVHVTEEVPWVSVAAVLCDTDPPPETTLQDTFTPLFAFPYWSLVATTSGCGSNCPAAPLWEFPETVEMVAAGPALTVARKNAFSLTPSTLTQTVSMFAPTPVPRVQLVETIPSAFVVAVPVEVLPLLMPAAKCTIAPPRPVPEEDVTFAAIGWASRLPASPVW
jgi:hypothetical protein